MAKRHYLDRAYGEPALRSQGGYIEKKARVYLSNPDVVAERTINYTKQKIRLIKKKKESHEQLQNLRDMEDRFNQNGVILSDNDKRWLNVAKEYYEVQRSLDYIYEIEDQFDKPIPAIGAVFWFLFITLPKALYILARFMIKLIASVLKLSFHFSKETIKILSIDVAAKKAKSWLKLKYSNWKLKKILDQLNTK